MKTYSVGSARMRNAFPGELLGANEQSPFRRIFFGGKRSVLKIKLFRMKILRYDHSGGFINPEIAEKELNPGITINRFNDPKNHRQ